MINYSLYLHLVDLRGRITWFIKLINSFFVIIYYKAPNGYWFLFNLYWLLVTKGSTVIFDGNRPHRSCKYRLYTAQLIILICLINKNNILKLYWEVYSTLTLLNWDFFYILFDSSNPQGFQYLAIYKVTNPTIALGNFIGINK